MGFSKKKGAQEYLNRGMAKYQKGDIKGAIDDYNKALEVNPHFPEVYYNRGVCWQYEEDYDRAIADYTEAIRSSDSYSAAHVNRGYCWQQKGDQSCAIKDFNKALNIRSNDYAAYHNRGISWQNIGEYDRSIDDFNRALEINPQDDLSLYSRCGSWTYKGEFTRALKDVEEAIRLRPDFDLFHDMAEYLRDKIQEEKKWDIFFNKALYETEKKILPLCGPYPDCDFVINAEEHYLLASWGFFNPFGPTYESLCLSKIPSKNAHFIFLKLSNPFSESSTIYSMVPDPIDNSVFKLTLEKLFSTNGAYIPIFQDAPSFVFIPDNSLIEKNTIKDLFFKAFKAADVVGLDNKCSLLKKHWCDPWKRSAVERDIGLMLMAKEMGKLDEMEKYRSRTDFFGEWRETKINENDFAEWWSLVTDAEHIKVEIDELPNAWQGSIDFQNENTTNPLESTDVQEGLKFHYRLYRNNCPD